MRIATILAVALLGTTSLAGAEHAQAAIQHYQLNIPRQSLDTALRDLAQQTGLQIGRFSERIDGSAMVGPVLGDQTPAQALKTLLKNTGLEYKIVSDTTIAVYNPKDGSSAQITAPFHGREEAAETKASSDSDVKEGGKNTSQSFRVAQVDQGKVANSSSLGEAVPSQQNSGSSSAGLQEIIVTARKRSELLENVPVAVSVVTADSMVQQGALSMQDYYASVPGLSIVDSGNGRLEITMRGLSTGSFTNPTVGITIDDVPIGTTDTAIINGASFVPQLDPADLQRIEFLKGPQGTLYGATSVGGVMRYVTAEPNLTSASGSVEADGSAITRGGQGYGVRGSVNAPLIADTLAIRVSAFDRHDPGFVDDPSHGRDDVNSTDIYGAHAAVLWQAAQNFNVHVAALYQRTEGNGDGSIDTNYLYQALQGGLTQDRLPGTGVYAYQLQLYSATLNFHSDLFDVTSITGYSINDDRELEDVTPAYASLTEAFFPGAAGASLPNVFDATKFTQEVRLSSAAASKVEWQIGGFYTDENNGYLDQQIVANNLATGVPVGVVAYLPFATKYEEYAGFANLTYHFTDQFNIQVGGRESHNWQRYHQDDTGPLFGGIPDVYTTRSNDNSFTYLVTPQLRLSDSLMAYVRVASGYEAGGPNTPFTVGTTPLTYAPSTTVNYELGLKSRLLDNRLSVDANVFYINWSKIQLTGTTQDQASYIFNGGKAKSQGLEIATAYEPLEGLTISGAAAYIDAKLTDTPGLDFPGVAGNSLPYSSKLTGSLAIQEKFRISPSMTGFVGTTAAYVGRRYGSFPATLGQPQPIFPSYEYLNLQGGIEKSGYRLTAFLNNVTDERGILSSAQITGRTATSGLWRTAVIRPRIIGLSLMKSF